MARLPDIDLDLKLPKPPFWLIAGFIIFVVLSWIPLALIARARVTNSPHPRVHLFHDMDHQPKVKAQDVSRLFRDHRAMRPPVRGTVARGQLNLDDHYHRGYTTVTGEDGKPQTKYFEGMPEQVEVSEAFVRRGQTQYNNYCYPCHGLDGAGDGPVNQRAQSLVENTDTSWITPTSLQSQTIRERSEGYLFNVISNGVRNMPGYASQIAVEDRWAIVSYIRALQLSDRFPADELPADQREQLGE